MSQHDDESFDDCTILSADAFDPDALFLDDIVDDDVLPYLSLAVDGLTDTIRKHRSALELRPGDVAANDVADTQAAVPKASLDPEQLEVYGWESSLWRKVKGYIGF